MTNPEEIKERSTRTKGPESTVLLGERDKDVVVFLMLPIEDYL
ncbi:MAG: hypothetical protein R3B51_05750 [Thermodesulfobacteriota bacterium]